MILTDVNPLLHAYDRDFPDHAAARKWWEGVTNPRAMLNPMPVGDAVAAAKSWLDLPNVDVIEPEPRHAEILFRLLPQVGVAGNLTTDAHLAVLAIEHQARLASTDTAFARFPGLRWFHPLAKSASGR